MRQAIELQVRNLRAACLALAIGAVCALPARAQEVWRFDRTAALGGHPTKVLGHPAVIDTPMGKAVQFNGLDDALFVDVHPLAGAATWTWEMIFKPDADGKPEQRVFHLQAVDPATGTYSPTRRGQNSNPGYEDFDLAASKTTAITERVQIKFTANMYNLVNHTNLAPAGQPSTSDTGGTIGSTFGAYAGAPGIGVGEPFNTNLAAKIIF